MSSHVIAIYGPTGYTGRQVLAQLREQGVTPLLVGRARARLDAVADGDDVRVATLDDPSALHRAFDGAAAVINCVGPFETSAVPVAAAAVSVGAHYLDVTGEQAPVIALADRLDDRARRARVAVVPAAGFYGGLGDLLVSWAAGESARLVDVTIAYAVENWLLTKASRATAAAMAGRRWVRRDGECRHYTGERAFGTFRYPAPLGVRPVLEDYPLPEVITVPWHVNAPTVRTVMTTATLSEVFSPDAPAPDEVSDQDRAGSRFTVVAVVADRDGERRTVASGADIYGVTVPIVVLGARALLASDQAGVRSLSQVVSARDLLVSLTRTRGVAVHRDATSEVTR